MICILFFFTNLSEESEKWSESDSQILENKNDLIQVGYPKILKFQAENKNDVLVALNSSYENEHFYNKKFFERNLKDYLKGGFQCEFCLKNVEIWPSFRSKKGDDHNPVIITLSVRFH